MLSLLFFVFLSDICFIVFSLSCVARFLCSSCFLFFQWFNFIALLLIHILLLFLLLVPFPCLCCSSWFVFFVFPLVIFVRKKIRSLAFKVEFACVSFSKQIGNDMTEGLCTVCRFILTNHEIPVGTQIKPIQHL